MRDSYDDVLTRLRQYRKKMKLKQSEICEQMGITQSHYSKIERRDKIISNESLMKLCENGIDIDYLVTGKETHKTILDELFYKCPQSQRENLLNLMVLYVNIAVTSTGREKTLCYTKELEILRFEFEEKVDDNEDTVWNCIRRISGLTQEKLAHELGIDIKSYREIEKERSMPNAETLTILYEKYGYYPSLITKRTSNYLFSINHVWSRLPEDVQERIAKVLENDLEYILNMQRQ